MKSPSFVLRSPVKEHEAVYFLILIYVRKKITSTFVTTLRSGSTSVSYSERTQETRIQTFYHQPNMKVNATDLRFNVIISQRVHCAAGWSRTFCPEQPGTGRRSSQNRPLRFFAVNQTATKCPAILDDRNPWDGRQARPASKLPQSRLYN
jgi:hypothetical protein